MKEDAKLSKTILQIIAEDESHPARITALDIRNSNTIKENFEDIDDAKIDFHVKMLEDADLIEVKSSDISTFHQGAERYFTIIGLTKKGNDFIEYINSPLWKQAIQSIKSSKKPLTIQLIYDFCGKFFSKN